MHCSYCGKSFLMASKILNDPDFCSPTHRWKFHKRLGVAIRLIERADELHPRGLVGFRQLAAAYDYTYEFSTNTPGWRARAMHAPALRLVAIGEELAFESLTETTVAAPEPVTSEKQTDRRAQLQGVRDLVTQLRRDVERRRQEAAANANSSRVLARVLEFKPGAPTPAPVWPTAAELPLAVAQ